MIIHCYFNATSCLQHPQPLHIPAPVIKISDINFHITLFFCVFLCSQGRGVGGWLRRPCCPRRTRGGCRHSGLHLEPSAPPQSGEAAVMSTCTVKIFQPIIHYTLYIYSAQQGENMVALGPGARFIHCNEHSHTCTNPRIHTITQLAIV